MTFLQHYRRLRKHYRPTGAYVSALMWTCPSSEVFWAALRRIDWSRH